MTRSPAVEAGLFSSPLESMVSNTSPPWKERGAVCIESELLKLAVPGLVAAAAPSLSSAPVESNYFQYRKQ